MINSVFDAVEKRRSVLRFETTESQNKLEKKIERDCHS